MEFPPLTKEDIKEHTAGGSFQRGEQYLAEGSVQSLKQAAPQTLKATVQGTDVHPYLVTLRFTPDDITEVTCTCPYHGGTWCKHIVATMLKVLDAGDLPQTESATIDELVADLDRNELVSLIKRLVEHDPRLLDQIERERARHTESPPSDGTE